MVSAPMTCQEQLEEIVWIYAARFEINVEDLALLEAEHKTNVRALAGGESTQTADPEYLPPCRILIEHEQKAERVLKEWERRTESQIAD